VVRLEQGACSHGVVVVMVMEALLLLQMAVVMVMSRIPLQRVHTCRYTRTGSAYHFGSRRGWTFRTRAAINPLMT
jgi:hypothetical protein